VGIVRRAIVGVLLVVSVACTAQGRSPVAVTSDAVRAPTSPRTHTASPSAPSTPAVVIDPIDAPWTRTLDRIATVPGVSIAVGVHGRVEYQRAGDRPQALASNQKLLTSMAALDVLGPDARLRTTASIARDSKRDSVVRGDLWLIGGGDPTLDDADLASLAARVAAAGVTRITGRVMGDTSAFDRGWWAPGWLRGISRSFVARPVALRLATSSTALESAAASTFRDALIAAGVSVTGHASIGRAPQVRAVASIASPPLGALLVHQNHESDNLYAELLAKVLGHREAREASTAGGARVIAAWASSLGVRSSVRDGSGLSDQDRTSAVGVVWLLLQAERRPWFGALERSLPAGGDGTLTGRLGDVAVRAKTGTLFVRPTSTLSGFVTSADGVTIAFSILTHDVPQPTAESLEDAVVRALAGASMG
jgi:D-alanyl-D-alanine carboxypeptidase/D-alanyl-D-alanine-endopeptidase (penicillin-binding protein 4)